MPSLVVSFRVCNIKRSFLLGSEGCTGLWLSALLHAQRLLPPRPPTLDAEKARSFTTVPQELLEPRGNDPFRF